jgi:hypothetical protein
MWSPGLLSFSLNFEIDRSFDARLLCLFENVHALSNIDCIVNLWWGAK